MRLLLLVALLGASSAVAQPLTITPSPFDASGTAPLVMRNETTAPVRLDSLHFGRTIYDNGIVGWEGYYSIETPDGVREGILFCVIRYPRGASIPACTRGADDLFGQQIVPGGALTLDRFGLQCGACLQNPLIDDTMFVFTNGMISSQSVQILNGGFTAGDTADEAGHLAVSPNPAAQRVRLVLPAAEASRVTVADALGRAIAVIDDARDALDLDVSAWPPGVYTVRVEVGRRVETARLVVAR